MICYNIEFNENKIFTESYPYKIYLAGYIEQNKYKDNALAEKEYILFLETHSEKYQLSIKHYIKNIIILDIDIFLEKVEEFKIETPDKSLNTQFFYIPKNKNLLKYEQIKNCDNYFLENIFKEISEDDNEAYCICSCDMLISLEDINQKKHGLIKKNEFINYTKNDFAKKILNEKEYEKFKCTKEIFSFSDNIFS